MALAKSFYHANLMGHRCKSLCMRRREGNGSHDSSLQDLFKGMVLCVVGNRVVEVDRVYIGGRWERLDECE
jgi:hypothetical protein